jgi:hypothetical protein
VIKRLHPSRPSRIQALLLLIPMTSLLIGVAAKLAMQGVYLASAVFVIAAVLLAVFLVFQLTQRVEMDEHSITRSWLFGRTVVPVNEITRLGWNGFRELILTIRFGGKKFIQLSTNVFTEQELRGIHRDLLAGVLAVRGLEGEPLLPRFSESVGYVDIDEMVRQKHR